MKKILVLLVVLVVLFSLGGASTWHIPAEYNGLQDSVWLIVMTQAGGKRDSANMGAGQYYDTSITVNDDSAYYAVLRNWATDEDSAASWIFARNAIPVAPGDGLDTLHYYAHDSVSDTMIDGATINIKNATTGSWVYTTNSSGYILATLVDGATYYITANKSPGYIWPGVDTITSFSAGTDSIYGYNTASTHTGSVIGKTATVVITVVRGDNTGYEGVSVSAYIGGANIVDSAGRVVAGTLQRDKTDSNGQVEFTCMWSAYMIPATKWIFTVHKGSGFSEAVTVPYDSTTFNVNFLTND